MRLEVGKYYKTRDGRKVGPAKACGQLAWDTAEQLVELEDDKARLYRAASGVRLFPEYGGSDLIAEWTDGPVRTVTRREVVPGVYDRVSVWSHAEGGIGIDFHVAQTTPDELRAAAAVLLELAGALEE